MKSRIAFSYSYTHTLYGFVCELAHVADIVVGLNVCEEGSTCLRMCLWDWCHHYQLTI